MGKVKGGWGSASALKKLSIGLAWGGGSDTHSPKPPMSHYQGALGLLRGGGICELAGPARLQGRGGFGRFKEVQGQRSTAVTLAGMQCSPV